MQPTTNRNRYLFVAIIGVVFILGVIGIVTLSASSSKSGSNFLAPTPSVTPTPSPSPDAVPKGPSMPLFAGFDTLLAQGVTNDQIDSLKYAFFKYSKSVNKPIKQVTLQPGTMNVIPHDRFSTSTTNTITFSASLDGTVYPVKFEYGDLTTARLYLSAPSGQPVIYDSGTVDLYNSTGL